jgi:cytochrome c biogenesis protein CcmG/thiol:disulfide interchange protein DsbE
MGVHRRTARSLVLLAGVAVGMVAGLACFSGTPVARPSPTPVELGLGTAADSGDPGGTATLPSWTATPSVPTVPAAPVVGAPAPDFQLVSLDGTKVRLSNYRGRPVLVNFSQTWCGPCQAELPGLQELSVDQGPFGLEVLVVDSEEPEADVRSFHEAMAPTFHVLLDPEGEVEDLYRIQAYPTSFFIDREGIIRVVHIGEMYDSQLSEYLKLLGAGSP